MMPAETILKVANQLKVLFENKNELKGYDDWDVLIGCIITLHRIASELSQIETAEEVEEVGK